MNERIERLREQSVSTTPYISSERAELITEFYQSGRADYLSVPMARAQAFKYIMEHKQISIGNGELIVGERGPAPRAVPTYPELCCHTLEDLDILSSRERARFDVSDEVRESFEKRIIPFWQGKTMRELVFDAMADEWRAAFDAGVFTEFMEQRAPGHAIMDDKIYREGLDGMKRRISDSTAHLDYDNDPLAEKKREELEAMAVAADALIALARRYAEKAMELADMENDHARRVELERIAEICTHVPQNPPGDFWEALQMYWFIHLGVITELNVWDSFNPGRLDLNLYPFFRRGLEDGSLSKEFAKELLQCFWIKFNNQPAPPKVGVTDEQSATYQDFSLINVGGVDIKGEDAVNELSYLVLDVLEEMHMMMPSLCVQLSSKNGDDFLKRAVGVVKAGFGQPSFFNTDAIIEEFIRQGKSIEDARLGGPSGCVTISAFGKESCTLTGYMNWPKIIEITLNNGIDPASGKRVGLETGDPSMFHSFEELFDAYKNQLNYFVDVKIHGNDVIERMYAEHMPSPFMSLLVDDCIEKGKDYHDGGPRYNTTYIQGVGIGTAADSLAAIRYHVFENRSVKMPELLDALSKNFEFNERLRLMLSNEAPKYGNDDPFADSIAQSLFEAYLEAIDGRPNTKGGFYRVNLLPTTVHIYFGRVTGATPNGRRAGEPLSDGISPSQGADRKGPTAVIKSVASFDHTRTGGTLLNQKFLPQLLQSNEGMEKVGALIRAYFTMKGHHIQFNVVTAETLRDAQEHPERHRDLIVRVAGYSDYFVNLGKGLQDEIISRTEHGEF
ncbi:MAG: formate C-acetyltransferase/glycerol dehydratase family glycyl radical enzyme [Candidatus Latescibacteria bacterium 4484_7]|nr:MAG: formate C-acetyltransferase/glycerol dehydratase family glycyl radical enzyme [Candidatus Latescibacteria bacterium 4484_7]